MWARANGVDSIVLGITFMEELLGVFVRADDPAGSVADLSGRRLALPVWPRLVFNFFAAVVRYVRTLVRAARWTETNTIAARRLIARECSVGQDEVETCLESDYAGKFLPRVSGELVEALAVMKSFLHERRFIARDFDLEDWIDPRPLAEAYRLEGLDEVASTL